MWTLEAGTQMPDSRPLLQLPLPCFCGRERGSSVGVWMQQPMSGAKVQLKRGLDGSSGASRCLGAGQEGPLETHLPHCPREKGVPLPPTILPYHTHGEKMAKPLAGSPHSLLPSS